MTSDDFLRKAGKVVTELTNAAIFIREHGYPDRALRSFEILAQGDDTFEAGVYAFEIGRCYEDLKQPDEAAKYFQIAVRENPGVAEFREAAERFGLNIPPDPGKSV